MAFTSGRWQKPSSTSTEALEIFAKTEQLISKEQKEYNGEVTQCPMCGAMGLSRGKNRMKCPYCGTRWTRFPKRNPALKDDRPNCPDCGAKPNSAGNNWRCTRCERSWPKEYKRDKKDDVNKKKRGRPKKDIVYISKKREKSIELNPCCKSRTVGKYIKKGCVVYVCRECGREYKFHNLNIDSIKEFLEWRNRG